MARLEQAVIDQFHKQMNKLADQEGKKLHTFSLGAQDKLVRADYLVSHNSRFALIEYKYSRAQLKEEKPKELKRPLCKKLETTEGMKKLHDRCHYIAWLEKSSKAGVINIFRKQVCNKETLSIDCGYSDLCPDTSTLISIEDFSKNLMGGKLNSLPLRDFKRYLTWLLTEVGGSQKRSLELIAEAPDSSSFTLVELDSMDAVYEWTQKMEQQLKKQRSLGHDGPS